MNVTPVIPFNKPSFAGNEAYIAESIANRHISGDGPFTKKAQALLESTLGATRVLLTTNCTHALEMSALLLDLEPGDEVIVPAFTFVSTVNAFALRRAVPVFVDIRPDTLNIDERLIEAAITPRTKAIVVVHYAGVACEMDAIGAIARRHGLTLIEDNAHGLFGTYRGKPLGTLGELATQASTKRRISRVAKAAHSLSMTRATLSVPRYCARREPTAHGFLGPSRQVHLGRSRLELRPERSPRRILAGTTRTSHADPADSRGHLDSLCRLAKRLGANPRCPASERTIRS